MPPRVAISGYACLTAFGDERATWDALLAGRHIQDHARVPQDWPTHRALNQADDVLTRLLAGRAVHRDAALIVGTSKGAVEDWIAPPTAHSATSDNPAGASEGWGLADIASALARRHGLVGPRMTTSAACASGLHALIRGAMMIRAGEVRQALIMATESSLHPLFVGTFGRLGVLARPAFGCRPFDRDREGFLMSEAAAAVLLEAEDGPGDSVIGQSSSVVRHGQTTDNESTRGTELIQTPAFRPGLLSKHSSTSDSPDQIHANSPRIDSAIPTRNPPRRGGSTSPPTLFIDRYAIAADATHLTGSDPAGTTLRRVLAHVLDGRPVDLIHAHGTGTTVNDAMELAAIESAVGSRSPAPSVYSHKAALGHSLGASGLLSVVINCMSHQAGVVPPNPLTRNPLPARNVSVVQERIERPIRRSVAISAGFGGSIGAISFTD